MPEGPLPRKTTMTKPRITGVDGTFELYRAEYSKRPRKIVPIEGEPRDVTATVGLVSSLLALLGDPEERVTHLVYAFDNPIRSFRNDLFAGYKDDSGVPDELRRQFDLVERVVRSLGIAVLTMREHEADDGLGSLARAFSEHEVRLLSPDKDLGQCLEESGRVVTVDRIRKREIRYGDFVAQKGFLPRFLPDFLGLTGDPQDGIPGIPGFGEKTAAALLAAFPGLSAIPEDGASWPASIRGREKLARALSDARDDARLYTKLATLVTDVPLGLTLDALRVPTSVPEAFVREVSALGSPDLAERAQKVLAGRAPG